ncbi:MAG: DNA-deoxyinosine glycosylase [Pseudomonadota bacterium]
MTGPQSFGFPPIVGKTPRVLILGSLPSVRSIEKQQYYGHPQNGFWKIMQALLGDTNTDRADASYRQRTDLVKRSGIAVWDVLGQSVRPGSMDADIDVSTAEPNPLEAFLTTHASIRLIALNGRKAQQLFERFVDLSAISRTVDRALLPSTSPAYAAMSLTEKTERWRAALEAYLPALQLEG